MTSHGLSLSDVEIEQRQDFEQSEVDTGKQRSHAVEGTMNPIAEFCDVKVWGSHLFSNWAPIFSICTTISSIQTLYLGSKGGSFFLSAFSI